MFILRILYATPCGDHVPLTAPPHIAVRYRSHRSQEACSPNTSAPGDLHSGRRVQMRAAVPYSYPRRQGRPVVYLNAGAIAGGPGPTFTPRGLADAFMAAAIQTAAAVALKRFPRGLPPPRPARVGQVKWGRQQASVLLPVIGMRGLQPAAPPGRVAAAAYSSRWAEQEASAPHQGKGSRWPAAPTG